jgi:hypothetical protein
LTLNSQPSTISVLDSKPGIDAMKKFPGESFKCPSPPPIKMAQAVKAKVEKLFVTDNPPSRA